MSKDDIILEKINEKLVKHKDIEAGDIWVNVENGNATLAGSVSDEKTKQLTKNVVKRVDGVNEVIDLLETVEQQNQRRIMESQDANSDNDNIGEIQMQRNAMINEGGHDRHHKPPANCK